MSEPIGQTAEIVHLVGYVRRANEEAAIKISINKEAFEECETYTTSDGQQYIPLTIGLQALRRVIDGERTATTISQLKAPRSKDITGEE